MKTITLTEDEWHSLLWAYKSLTNWNNASPYQRQIDVETIHTEFINDMEQIIERLEKAT